MITVKDDKAKTTNPKHHHQLQSDAVHSTHNFMSSAAPTGCTEQDPDASGTTDECTAPSIIDMTIPMESPSSSDGGLHRDHPTAAKEVGPSETTKNIRAYMGSGRQLTPQPLTPPQFPQKSS